MTVYAVEKCPHCGLSIRQRSGDQNSALHAKLHDIAEQTDWPRGSGNRLDVEAFKRLFISAFERANGRSAEMYPALDGHGMDVVYRRSSRMSKQEMSDLLEFVVSQGIEWGIQWTREAA